MIEFKSAEDLSKLSPDDPAFPIVEDLVKRLITDYIAEGYDYITDDDGYTILVEPGDADRELTELWDGCRLTNIPWEGITLRDGFYIAIYPHIRMDDLRNLNKNHPPPMPSSMTAT